MGSRVDNPSSRNNVEGEKTAREGSRRRT